MAGFKPLARKNDIVVQEFDGELLIYDLEINRAFALNSTSSKVWQLCNGKNTIDDIANQLSVKLKELVSDDLVWLSVEQLKKENLIESESVGISKFEGLSRREVVRKIGLASLVALPVISSLVAPTAVQAGGSVVCVTVGNTACRCPCPATAVNSTCGQGNSVVPNGLCNANCTCTRTGAACPNAGAIAGTALGSCAP